MTPEELSHYREHGYVVQRALFSEDELQVWLDRLSALIRGEAPKSDGMLIMRDVMIAKGALEAASPEAAIAKIQDFDRDPVLRTYTDHPKLLAEIANLTGENIVSIHNRLINKSHGNKTSALFSGREKPCKKPLTPSILPGEGENRISA